MTTENLPAKVNRNTSVITAKVVDNPVSALIAEGVPLGTMQYSFTVIGIEAQQLIEDAEDNANYEPDDFMSKPFALENWFCKRTVMPNELTGEEVPAVRIVLFNDMNETVSFMSIGMLLSLDLLRTFRGDGPYRPAIKVFFKRTKTNRGFHIWKMKTWRDDQQ